MTDQVTAEMNTAQALRELGVTDDLITDAERRHLDEHGWLALEGMLSADQLTRLRARIEELLAEEGDQAGLEVHQEEGTDRLADLINKDPLFDVVVTHPRFLAAIRHVLGPEFKLSSLNFRSPHVGHGNQPLHADWFGYAADRDFKVCNSMWLIDDLTPDNGPTRLVPGSHVIDHLPADEMGGDAMGVHPREMKVIAPAGTVIVLNAHTWHGGTERIGGGPRRIMHGYFTHRDLPQQLDQRKYLRPETAARLSRAQLWLMDAL